LDLTAGYPSKWQTISGLKPATAYVFQARAVKKTGGYSDWSDSVTRVAV